MHVLFLFACRFSACLVFKLTSTQALDGSHIAVTEESEKGQGTDISLGSPSTSRPHDLPSSKALRGSSARRPSSLLPTSGKLQPSKWCAGERPWREAAGPARAPENHPTPSAPSPSFCFSASWSSPFQGLRLPLDLDSCPEKRSQVHEAFSSYHTPNTVSSKAGA